MNQVFKKLSPGVNYFYIYHTYQSLSFKGMKTLIVKNRFNQTKMLVKQEKQPFRYIGMGQDLPELGYRERKSIIIANSDTAQKCRLIYNLLNSEN